jgi:hypothetical protein
MAIAHPARRLLTLPLADLADLVTAQGVLLSALWALHRKPVGQLLRPVAASTDVRRARDEQWIERMATAIDRVARFGLFRPTCLVRAIALERLLRHTEAGTAALRIGIRRDHTTLLAHAWIELGGRVVGDDPSRVRRFTPLHDFSALPQ